MKRIALLSFLALAAIVFAASAAQADPNGNIITVGADVQLVNLVNTFKFGISGPDKTSAPADVIKTYNNVSPLAVGALLDYKYAFKNGVYVGGEFMYVSTSGTVKWPAVGTPAGTSDPLKWVIQTIDVGPLVGYYFLMGQARPYIQLGVDVATENLISGGNALGVGRKGHLQNTSADVNLSGGIDYVAPFGLVVGGGLRFDYGIAETFHDRLSIPSNGNVDKLTYTFNRLPLGVDMHIGGKF